MKPDEKCVCGHDWADHDWADPCGCLMSRRNVPCTCKGMLPVTEAPSVCTVDEQQCDAECQTRPDRVCAAEKPAGSVYGEAREALDAGLAIHEIPGFFVSGPLDPPKEG